MIPARIAAEQGFAAALAIEAAPDLGTIQDQTRRFAAGLGFDRFVLFSAAPTRDELVDRIYWLEGDWFGDGSTVDAATYVGRCPVTRHMLERRDVFFWTKTQGAAGECYRVLRRPRGPGIHGAQVPIFGPLGLEGALSLGGRVVDASGPARMALALVGTAAFVAARRLVAPPGEGAPSPLSERERQVLAGTAAGRRQAELAAAFGLSPRTVENHLRRIRQRLGVATTAQAIRVAIRNGDIQG